MTEERLVHDIGSPDDLRGTLIGRCRRCGFIAPVNGSCLATEDFKVDKDSKFLITFREPSVIVGDPPPPAREVDPIVLYIIVRRSLKMSAGKVGAQCGHAVQYFMQAAFPDDHMLYEEARLRVKLVRSETEQRRLDAIDADREWRASQRVATHEWIKGAHTKIILGASDDEFMKVQLENDHFFMVVDHGYTEVDPNTETALALWPCRKSEASETVRSLKPLREER